jgi:predicted nucleic acid-binding protein
VSYCIDTSSLIAAWEERYPPDHFPKFWQLLEAAITSGQVVVCEAVFDETKKRSEELHRWLRQFDGQIVPFEEAIQAAAKKVLAAFPRLVGERRIAFAADPFVIATAMVRGLTVVTEEGPGSPRKPHIPDVCRANGLECINLIRVIRAEAWIIS